MGMSTASFKEYSRLERVITVDDAFTGGMQYTNNPLSNGYIKTLVNFDLKDSGNSIVPRGGIQTIQENIGTVANTSYRIHHTGNIYVQDADKQDATVHKYVLLVKITDTGLYDFTASTLIVDVDGTYLLATLSNTYTAIPYKRLTKAHGVEFENEFTDNLGVYASVDANTYIPVYNTATSKRLLAHLKVTFNADKTAITYTLNALEPYEVKASQCINTGYNMLKENPYSFENTQNATGKLVLEGIIPKDTSGKIKLTANVGDTVIFHLHYTYPSTDSTGKYIVLWKVKNVNSSEDATVLRRIRGTDALEYTPGDDINLPWKVAYKQYTIIVEVYYKSDITAHSYVSDEDDYKNLKPIQSMTVSSYYMSNNVSGTNANLTMKTYDLNTCTGMCTWQQRMVLWGVAGATTTLWVSQPNKPEYMPYPNNVEVFQEPIMKCVPYLTNLLVFTSSKLYSLTFTTDSNGLTYYVTKCIQERLIMTEEDASTIQVVKNMVYFKSGTYFYMIVPQSSSTSGELQIAPVSNPITTLLDTFEDSVETIVDSVYNLRNILDLQSDTEVYEIKYLSYNNVLDGNTVRNVYRLLIEATYDGADNPVTTHLNLSLNYDTVLRAWTVYLYQVGENAMIPYQHTITDNMTFIIRNNLQLDIVQFNQTDPVDSASMTATRIMPNYQYIDTGYRAHYKEWKKRFREIQFVINSISQEKLTFYTTFTLDDDVRKELYDYTVTHVTDQDDVNYGLIYVERSLADPLTIADSTKSIPANGWTLDLSRFPDISVVKVRYKVSGKGYVGRISILSTNQTKYELININWVYRKMNAR